MGNIRYRYDTPVGGVRPVAMDYARYYNDGGPKKRTVINPEWEAFQNRLRQERFAENIAASRGEYWDKNWYDPNYKSGLYSFDDNGILTYQGQTYAPFGNSEKEGITVPVRTPHGISYGANVVYYPIEVPQQYIEEEYYEPEQEPQPEVAIEPPVNSPMVAKQKSAGKKIPTTQGQHDVDISFARFYKERGKDSIGKNRGNRTPFEDVSTEYENWVNKKLVDEYKIKYMSDDYKNYWRFHKDRANRDELNNTYVTYGGVKYILPFGASNKREDIWRGLYSEKDYAQYSKGTWQKEKRDKLGSMHGLFPSLATEIKINNQGDTISYRVLNPVTQSNLEPKKEYGHPSDFQNGSESIAGSRLGYNSWYQERTGYDKSVAGRVSENIKDYWSDGIGTGIKRMFSKNENEDGLIKKIRKASQYSKEGMPTLERIRKIFKANGGPLRHDRNYNTILPQGQESAYQQWVQTLPINLRSDYDYDLRGAWLNGDLPDENYHMSDRWKKPWHATFSDESVYSGDGAVGGHWYGDRFEPSALNRYVGGFRYGNWGAESFGDGGGIHIKKANRGKFTAAAERAGKSVQAYASQILANKGNYSPTLVKRANFARNAAKWHGYGGNLYGPGGVASPDDPPRKVDFFAGMSPMSAGYSGPAVVVADNTQRIVPVTQEKVAVQQSLADNKAATIAKEVADTDARRFGYANAEDRVEKEAYAAAVAAHEADMGEIRPYDGKITPAYKEAQKEFNDLVQEKIAYISAKKSGINITPPINNPGKNVKLERAAEDRAYGLVGAVKRLNDFLVDNHMDMFVHNYNPYYAEKVLAMYETDLGKYKTNLINKYGNRRAKQIWAHTKDSKIPSIMAKSLEQANNHKVKKKLSRDDIGIFKQVKESYLANYAKKFYKKSDVADNNVFTTEDQYVPKKDGNRYQHYNFVGKPGEKGLEFLGFLPKESWSDTKSGSGRMHFGGSDPRFSHKTRAVLPYILGTGAAGIKYDKDKYNSKKDKSK